MRKILVLDLKDHIKTKSTYFLRDILERRFEVDWHFASGRYAPDMCTAEQVAAYDAIVFFQMSPSVARARTFRRPMIYLPMYDGESFNPWKWRRIALMGGRVISFGKVITSKLLHWGVDVLPVRFYPKKREFCPGNPRKVFLWDRGGVSLRQLLSHIDPTYFEEIIVRTSDKSNRISVDEQKKNRVRYLSTEYFTDRNAYLDLIKDCGVYVAPRFKEGIGMSFLEAMSLGKCVIAHDDSTMSDYIQSGENGILVNMTATDDNRVVLSEACVSKMQRAAYDGMAHGIDAWTLDQERILQYVESAIDEYKSMSLLRWALWCLYLPMQFQQDVRNYLRLRVANYQK